MKGSTLVGAGEADAMTQRRVVFAVVCVGYVVTSLDMMIVNVAFPALRSSFAGSDDTVMSWTLTAYTIVFAAALIPAGRWADRVGRRPAFLTGMVVFTLASIGAVVAPSLAWLIASRAVQALGAAALVPTSLALLLSVYPKEAQPSAVRSWTAVGSVAAATAPIIGGLLVQLDWRWIFLINVPLGVATVLIGRSVLPRDHRAKTSEGMPDLLGAAAIAVGTAALVYALVEGPELGWLAWPTLVAFTVLAVALIVAVFRNLRHSDPVIPMQLLRLGVFMRANLAALVFSASFSAMLLSFMQWCQDVRGYSALMTGLALLPGTALMPFFAVATGRIVKRIGATGTAALGCVLLAAGVAWWFVTIDTGLPYVAAILPGALLTPIGTILANAALTGIATGVLPAQNYAAGSAVNLMLRQLGMAVGVAGFIATASIAGTGVPAFRAGWVFAIAAGVAAAALCLTARPSRASRV